MCCFDVTLFIAMGIRTACYFIFTFLSVLLHQDQLIGPSLWKLFHEDIETWPGPLFQIAMWEGMCDGTLRIALWLPIARYGRWNPICNHWHTEIKVSHCIHASYIYIHIYIYILRWRLLYGCLNLRLNSVRDPVFIYFQVLIQYVHFRRVWIALNPRQVSHVAILNIWSYKTQILRIFDSKLKVKMKRGWRINAN